MYDELFEAWKKEKENAEIQPLPRGFYADLAAYVKRIRREGRMLDEKSIKGRLVSKEEENVKLLIEELLQTRHEKMMRTVAEGRIVPTAALTEKEINLYNGASSQDESFKELCKDLVQGRLDKKEREKMEEPVGLMVVRILQEIPEIIGADMKAYGPFNPEDIATLPKENARNLIKQGAAMEVETP